VWLGDMLQAREEKHALADRPKTLGKKGQRRHLRPAQESAEQTASFKGINREKEKAKHEPESPGHRQRKGEKVTIRDCGPRVGNAEKKLKSTRPRRRRRAVARGGQDVQKKKSLLRPEK